MASIHRLSPVLAIAVGVLHAGLSPVLIIGGVMPNLLVVATVLVAVRYGFLSGASWAFVGGLSANLLAGEPLGAVPLSLLPLAAAAPIARTMSALRPLFAVLAVFVGSIVADGVLLGLRALLTAETWAPPMEVIVRAAIVNAGLAALIVAAAWLLAMRARQRRAAS